MRTLQKWNFKFHVPRYFRVASSRDQRTMAESGEKGPSSGCYFWQVAGEKEQDSPVQDHQN
jgi:hypothetical protein